MSQHIVSSSLPSLPIHTASIRDLEYSKQSQLILPNEISGLVTNAIKLSSNQSITFPPSSPSSSLDSFIIRIYLILQGSCNIIS